MTIADSYSMFLMCCICVISNSTFVPFYNCSYILLFLLWCHNLGVSSSSIYLSAYQASISIIGVEAKTKPCLKTVAIL